MIWIPAALVLVFLLLRALRVKSWLSVSIIIALTPLLLFLGREALWLGSWEDEVKMELASPDKKYIATLFERSGGATTGFTTIVNLRWCKEEFDGDEKGNILRFRERVPIEMEWKGIDHLHIQRPAKGIEKEQTVWYGKTITYEGIDK